MSYSRLGAVPAHGLALTGATDAKAPFTALLDVKIVAAQWMAALAMRLRAFLGCCGINHCSPVPLVQVAGIEKRDGLWNAASQSSNDHIVTNSSSARPILGNHAHAHERDPYVVMPVLVLVRPWNPLAILRRVVPVIVLSVKA